MKKLIIALFAFVPVMAFADTSNGITGVLTKITDLFGTAYTTLLGFAGLIFAFAVVKLIFVGDDDDGKQKEGLKNLMLYSIGALVLMFSVWGIVKIVKYTFLDDQDVRPIDAPPLPSVVSYNTDNISIINNV